MVKYCSLCNKKLDKIKIFRYNGKTVCYDYDIKLTKIEKNNNNNELVWIDTKIYNIINQRRFYIVKTQVGGTSIRYEK